MSWIIGDAFLVSRPRFFRARRYVYSCLLQKNVYTVFRYNPAAVGFAALSDVATSQNGLNDAPLPSPTVGSSAAAVTSVNAASISRISRLAKVLMGIVLVFLSLV